jgi:hypothetical protein
LDALLFGETQSRVIVSVAPMDVVKVVERAKILGVAPPKSASSAAANLPSKPARGKASGRWRNCMICGGTPSRGRWGEVLAVTDDYAERDTVFYQGGMASSCANFIETVERALQEQERDIARHNRRQKTAFKASR